MNHPDIRKLTRFTPRRGYEFAETERLRHGVYLDVEATSLDPLRAKLIELAMLPFTFDPHGRVLHVEPGVDWFDDPGEAISPEVTALTGITDAMVAGQRFDAEHGGSLLATADLVIAHNASYDRRIVERYLPVAATVPWACSYREVNWRGDFGCPCSKLAHILIETCNEFYDAHRALDDCRVGLHVLAGVERGGRTALADLLDSARKPTHRVWAVGSPYGLKDTLKERGYRWHDGVASRVPKNWYRDCTPETYVEEMAWLSERFVRGRVEQFTALDRYSQRVAG